MTASRSPERTVNRSRGMDESDCASTVVDNRKRACRREIADLSNEQIQSMSDDELFKMIRASEHPWESDAMERHLIYADRSTLLRLAYLVRNCCRNAERAAHDQKLMDQIDGAMYRREAGTLFGNPR